MSEHSIFSNQADYIHCPDVRHYHLTPPFDPPVAFPEYQGVQELDPANRIYPMVRGLLGKLRLDEANFGRADWNPFGGLIRPGDRVLIKPNLVTHRHYRGSEALYSTVVHGSVLRPIIDYCCLALKGEGTVVIADNPVENSDFDSIMQFTGIGDMYAALRARGNSCLQVLDLRPRVLLEAKSGDFAYQDQPGDPSGYVEIDLKKDSLFSELDGLDGVHYYTLADSKVNHFNPYFNGASTTDLYHNRLEHRYVVSKSVLQADVLINVGKLKTHCKAGATLSLKNMIGIVPQKNCMPHHRPGLPPGGDSFPRYPQRHYIFLRNCYRVLRRTIRLHAFPFFRPMRNFLQKNEIIVGQQVEYGDWKGNDTIWRTILDLNRIAVYADSEGVMQEMPQRRSIAFVDGIIGQQGDAPISGEPVVSSVIIGGCNPVVADALAIKIMGLKIEDIKAVARAAQITRWPLLPSQHANLTFDEKEMINLHFKMPKGWR